VISSRMYENILQTLTKNFYTIQDVNLAASLLKEFFDSYLFKSERKEDYRTALKKFLKDKTESEHIVRVLLSFKDDFYEAFNAETVAKIFHELENELEEHKSIILYVPTLLPGEETKKIGEWMRSNVASNILIDIKVDRFATGGCAFVWNGIYYDFSLRYFMKKKEKEVAAAIRSYREEV